MTDVYLETIDWQVYGLTPIINAIDSVANSKSYKILNTKYYEFSFLLILSFIYSFGNEAF